MVEPALFLQKQDEEVTEVDADQHQKATGLREVHWQANMENYTVTLSDLHTTIMDTFPTDSQINIQKKWILR